MITILTRIEDMLALCERRINIGINPLACEKTRHGVLWVEADATDTKKNLRVPIIIDKPHLVSSGLNYATWKRVKRQVEKMGIKATHIELKFNDRHYCYEVAKYKELYAGNRGTPVYVRGYA